MFGVTIEKLFLVAMVAAVVIGPHRLAQYTRTLADTVRSLRGFVEATRSNAERELGMPLTRDEWQRLNLRQYDPRTIVREALELSRPTVTSPQGQTDEAPTPRAAVPADRGSIDPIVHDTGDALTGAESLASSPVDASASVGLDRIRPGQRYLVVGGSGHPSRILLSSLPADDPRRIAAERVSADDSAAAVAAG